MTNETKPKDITQYSDEDLQAANARLDDLTPEEFIELEGQLAQLKTALQNTPLGEAHCIMWMNLETASGDQVNFTVRGFIPEDVADDFVRGLRYVGQKYGLQPRNKRMQGKATGPVTTTTTQTASQPQNVPVSPQDSTDPGATPDQDGRVPGQVLKIEIARIAITPLADGTKIKFYPFLNNGMVGNWEITNKDKPVQEWVQDFANVGGYDFSVAGQYDFVRGQLTGEFVVSQNKKRTGRYYVNYVRLLA